MEDRIQAHLHCSPHGILHLEFSAMVSTLTAFVGIPVCCQPCEDLGNIFRDQIPWTMVAVCFCVYPQALLRVRCFSVLPERLAVNSPD